MDNKDFNIRIYMNTWKNYNMYGADLSAYGINSIADGWLTIDQALEFCEKHAEDEPFINDIDNDTGLNFDISDYDNAPSVLEGLKMLEETIENSDLDSTEVQDIYEAWSDYEAVSSLSPKVISEFSDFLDNGEYYHYTGIENEYDLGQWYVDNVGFDGVSNIENYLDTAQMKEDWQDDINNQFEEDSEEWFEVDDYILEDDIQSVLSSGNQRAIQDMLDRYFDYEALGAELYADGGFYFTSSNNCVEIR